MADEPLDTVERVERHSMVRSTIDAAPPGMKWIDGGEFAMGSDAFYAEERPVHRVAVDGFWMDERRDRCGLPALRPRHGLRHGRRETPRP
jgi:hypothetical protein